MTGRAGDGRMGLGDWWGQRLTGRRTRWVILLLWVMLAAVLSVVWPSAAQMENPNPPSLPASASSVAAGRLQQQAFGAAHTMPGLLVFYQRTGITSANRQAIAQFLGSVTARPLPRQAGAPLLTADALATQLHQHPTTVVVPVAFQSTAAAPLLTRILTKTTQRLQRHLGYDLITAAPAGPRMVARLTGPAGIAIDASQLFSGANLTLLIATTLLVLVLLVLIYRSPLLPWVPLVGVGFAYAVTSAILGALARAGHLVLDAETVAIMTVLMFGAGTDYALLVVARYREQLSREADHLQALGRAVGQAAGPVAMSAGTVMTALLALLLAQYGPDHRFAIPFVVAVGMTALASLTLVPACLALLGRAAFFPFAPRVGSDTPGRRHGAPFAVRRPGWAAAGVAVLLAALAAFAPSIRTTYNLLSALPANSQARQGYALVAAADGPGSTAPATILISGAAARHDLARKLAEAPGVAAVSGPTFGRAGREPVTAYQVALSVNPLSNRAADLLPGIVARAGAAVAANGGGRVAVSGATAQNANAAHLVNHDAAVVIPLVLVGIFLLLFAYLRSLVAAAYLVATVVLSYGAALGLGYLVLTDILHVGPWAGGVSLYAFVFLVALGEDYNIFMVSAIWRAATSRPLDEAVAYGVESTRSVILAAGVILAGTFAVLTALPLTILLQFGTVTALGVLLDTLLVRSVLVPAITVLLGPRAFWPARSTEGPAPVQRAT